MGPSRPHRRCDGRELTGRLLRERRARLEDIVTDNDLIRPVRQLARNGFEAWAER
jgi:ATP-dependent DNA ligase